MGHSSRRRLPGVEQEEEHEADGPEVDVPAQREVVQPGGELRGEEGPRPGEPALPGQHQRGIHLYLPGAGRQQQDVAKQLAVYKEDSVKTKYKLNKCRIM